MRQRPQSRAAAMLGVALAIAAGGCGGDGDATGAREGATAREGTFVGRVDGTNAFVALTSRGERVGGYVCDSRKVSVWLKPANRTDRSVELVSRSGDRLGEVRFDGDRASGTVELAGARHPFEAALASGDAGLYRAAEGGRVAVEGNLEATWIVLPDGTERGASAPWTNPETSPVVGSVPPFSGQASVGVRGATLRPQPWTDPNTSP